MKTHRFLPAMILIVVLALVVANSGENAFAKDKSIYSKAKSKVAGLFFAKAPATEIYLRAEAVTLVMPDGEVVDMWGFAQDSAFEALDGTVTIPGPAIAMPPGGGQLTIYLDNNLPKSTSVYIPGIREALGGNPVRIPGNRVRSFLHETTPGNTTAEVYSWNLDSGSYIYHSGTHLTVQVPMGLYGAIKVDETANVAYLGTRHYATEVVLFFHEIDPELNAAVAADDFGPGKSMTSTTDYQPDYFLINGEPFSENLGFDPNIPAGHQGQTTLIRFFNAGMKFHAPMTLGLDMEIVAEDGHAYPYPVTQYSVFLAPLQSKDVLIRPMQSGFFPIFDRRLFLSNGMESPGGMLRNLEIQPVP